MFSVDGALKGLDHFAQLARGDADDVEVRLVVPLAEYRVRWSTVVRELDVDRDVPWRILLVDVGEDVKGD